MMNGKTLRKMTGSAGGPASRTRAEPGPSRSNRHVLLLAWSLPPTIDGGVYRPTSFLKYGTKMGWRFSAVAGPYPARVEEAGRHLLGTIPDDVSIYRLPQPLSSRGWLRPRLIDNFIRVATTVSLTMRLFRNDPPAVVVATGPPFYNFVVASHISKLFQSKLILDYRDEWTESPFRFPRDRWLDRFLETWSLKRASAVVFTTESQLEHQVKTFDVLSGDLCHVVANGWEPADWPTAGDNGTPGKEGSAGTVISFVGTLFSPDQFGSFLADLESVLDRRNDLKKNLRIRFVGQLWDGPDALLSRFPYRDGQLRDGPDALLSRFPYRDQIERFDLVPRPVANRISRESQGLLLLTDERFSRYRPGKLYEYLAAGSHIIVYGHRSESSELVLRLGAGTFIPDGDDRALEQVIDQLRRTPDAEDLTKVRRAWLQEHTREAQARRFFDILERC